MSGFIRTFVVGDETNHKKSHPHFGEWLNFI
jgi:hypothetical protein